MSVRPGYVKTIREKIFFEFAKLVSRTSLKGNIDYPFVANRFKALLSGRITMQELNREWRQSPDLLIACAFCGTPSNLDLDYLIPLVRGGSASSENAILSCPDCRSLRGDQGVFRWIGLGREDTLHPAVAGGYLKELSDIHARKGTLEIHRQAITLLCPGCRNGDACREAQVAEELTCLCLESVL
ncbi:MAG TPA: HNH endonuclease [Deltaproteobacteria bacterium]|mgnify:CR=1 FL=1|jgi:hypothetical protein|nr:HNH endonuclease [Deltaproteobacteria bacterium]HOI05673.1 HNH endonuclease [Deltaproteobacteria bacterium]